MNKKLIIVGGGPAGLAAACAAYDNGIAGDDILIIERSGELGGILNQCIHAGFGLKHFGAELTGPEYAGRFIDRVAECGIGYVTDSMVLSVAQDKTVTFISPSLGFVSAHAEAIILAMGCRERTRGALSIPGTRPAGVYTAGTAQRFINIEGYEIGRRAVILGSGDIGLIMARRLTLEGASVECVCEIMPYSGGLARNIAQCLDDFGIPLYLSHTVTKIHGENRVTGVTISAVDDKLMPIAGTERFIECDTLLLSVGLLPENELTAEARIELDRATGGAVVDEKRESAARGIFACGNVLMVHDLVDYVTEEAETAGASAARYIESLRRTGADFGADNVSARACARTKAGINVKFVVPQRVSADDNNDAFKLFFRTDATHKNVTVSVSADGEIIFTRKKRAVTPGEMETAELVGDAAKKARCANIITVDIN